MPSKVSVLILAKNEETSIADCIRSILESPLNKNLEILLVDSKSEDRTIEIAKEFPISIYQLSQGSIGTAMNLLLEKGQGEYCFKVDGDSIVPADFLEKAVAVLDEDKEVAIVTGVRKEKDASSFFGKLYFSRFKSDKVGYAKNMGGNFLFRKDVAKQALKRFPDNFCKEETLLAVKVRSVEYKLKRIKEISMIHDSSREGHSFSGYVKKNIWYALENSIFLKQLTLKELFDFREPHLAMLLYTMAVVSTSLLLGSIWGTLMFLPFILVFFRFLGKRLGLGASFAVFSSLFDASLFYIRSYGLLYYLLIPPKTSKIDVIQLK